MIFLPSRGKRWIERKNAWFAELNRCNLHLMALQDWDEVLSRGMPGAVTRLIDGELHRGKMTCANVLRIDYVHGHTIFVPMKRLFSPYVALTVGGSILLNHTGIDQFMLGVTEECHHARHQIEGGWVAAVSGKMTKLYGPLAYLPFFHESKPTEFIAKFRKLAMPGIIDNLHCAGSVERYQRILGEATFRAGRNLRGKYICKREGARFAFLGGYGWKK